MLKIFIGVSRACCNWLKHYKINAKGVLSNAIEVSEYDFYKDISKTNQKNIRILYAGRLIKDKGIILLVEAFKRILNNFTNVELFIAGDGPLEEILKKEKNMQLLGKLNHEELMKEYAKADIFINPSYSEGLPTTVLEAGLMKCAVVATDVGGTSEIIEDRKEGLLCKPEVLDITEKLEVLIKDEILRETLGEKLHEKVVKQFSWDNTANKILELLQK
ncbi:MAG: glycosyltransferase family 4 protein [Clostridia bacterium]|nr:glycosyltransferase family 4 protein [Clostridia bacterium]